MIKEVEEGYRLYSATQLSYRVWFPEWKIRSDDENPKRIL